MTVMATKFTPEVLLSAPRRSAAVPNSTGTLALFAVTQYSFDTHTKSYAIKVLDVKTGQSSVLFDDPTYTEPTWISDTEFVFVKNGDSSTNLLVGDATKPGLDPYTVATFDGALSNIKAKDIGNGTVAFAGAAPTTANGEMLSPEDEKPLSSARVYTGLFVRHWDAYVSKSRVGIFYGALKRDEGGRFKLEPPGLVNALAGTPLESPVPPFGGADDYDIGPRGLIFVAKDPELNPALWTKTDMYYVPLRSFTEKAPKPQIVKTGMLEGYTGAPTFSHSGTRVAFKRMRNRQYESDKWRLLLLPDIDDLSNVQEFYATEDGEGGWDARPEGVAWSNDDSELYVTAEKHGRQLLFKLPSDPLAAAKQLPQPLTKDGAVGPFFTLAASSPSDTRILVSSTSLVDNSSFSIVDAATPADAPLPAPTLVSSSSREGKTFGLSRQQVDEFWFKGAGGQYECHALVVKPSDFDPRRRYPLALLIHGGPQGAWGDSWSTRWNPAVFAEQGYVAVLPNPTGSTGYGQALTDGIASDWGGRPYNDLVNCFEYIADNIPYIDTDNAVALGASYGGYMINWIQGHPLGRKFKALVCHDGIYSTMSNWSTEELFFPVHDFGGTLWENRAVYERWDPAASSGSWATPQLIVHSELDYRLPISEGLAAFNALQVRGVPSRFLTFPDENHWVLKPENSLVWHREVLDWINRWTGLADKAKDEDEEASAGVENLNLDG
ncbi:Alpha/Beta hydrolase protein [Durotheca rogersii]|uniref:Alpha/Beta hydrolase protein n=1 Tax=Durotheca rogersii TaxID=419775 RepID=UPI00221F4C5E|nr:Alpha/Beta hydrolase protein [Durotheca rogersii]KAI5862169.1 Alpha/Beta hydrolase protein [Durotheca rogersii]